MESEISHIFENNDQPQRPPSPTHSVHPPAPQSESTPLEYVQDPEPSYHQSQMSHPPMQHPPPYYYHHPPVPPVAPLPPAQATMQQWEPFKNIGTSTWIILIVAFAMGFFLGKFK